MYRRTISFIVALCFTAALILAGTSTALQSAQLRAKQLDTAKQMLQAAEIEAPKEEVLAVWKKRLTPMLVDDQGEIKTFEEAGVNYEDYVTEHQSTGYYQLPQKLIYTIDTGGYIIPISGFGLWGPIYGYLAIAENGDTVIGASWYAPQETPGLGAIIQDPQWLAQFPGKEIFLPGVDRKVAPLGILVVKGKVSTVLGDTPRAKTAVDGITGATLTGNGVTNAYQETLAAYRPFLLKVGE